jgi:hypothetical protein
MLTILAVIMVLTAATVAVSVFVVLWRGSTSDRERLTALVTGAVLALWAVAVIALARDGFFLGESDESIPPVGIHLVLTLVLVAILVRASASLRGLLARPSSLVRLHAWRVVGVTFIVLAIVGRLPAVFAVPAGIGDLLIGATTVWVAGDVETREGISRVKIWNWLGLADLVLAISLGVMTNPGRLHFIRSVPSSEVMTQFPMVLVPAFLVPVALATHVVSLLQLYRGTWPRAARRGRKEDRHVPAPHRLDGRPAGRGV